MSGFVGSIARWIVVRRWIVLSKIPSEEVLWRAVRKKEQLYADGRPKPSFFRDKSGLSCDIARFSTVEDSRLGHGEVPFPVESGLVRFSRASGRKVR
ncbi:MAG: hypothetical protein MUF00_13925, partial [Gemmatimonadaceae bacterium]|nr:hypothetical protein [Gemmatimonadaceae bacterium]